MIDDRCSMDEVGLEWVVDFYMSAIKSNPSTQLDHPRCKNLRSTLHQRTTPPTRPMLTRIPVISERGALVRQLICEQNDLWSHVLVKKINYDDEARTYSCWLDGNSAGGLNCLNHPYMKHEDRRTVIWFQVTTYGVRQRCTHRTFTNAHTGVRCKAYTSPFHRKGYTAEVMMRLFPNNSSVHSSSTPRPCAASHRVSVQDIYNQHGSDYDIMTHEDWFNPPSLH